MNSIAPVDLEQMMQTESLRARLFLRSSHDIRGPLSWIDTEQARDDVLQTALATQLFQRRHARYPNRIDELVPEFLPAVPEDLFAPAGTPLRYRLDADGVTIWSIGANERDDHGDFEKSNDIGFRLGVSSR